MFFDTSTVDSALQSLLAFRYPDADTFPVLATPRTRDRVKRTEELASLLREFERTIVAVAHLEVKVWALGRELRNRASTIATALAPVTALPTELLRDIFRMVVVDDDSSQSRIALSHVSSRWRSVSLALPELWTELQHRASYRDKMTTEFMARSRSLTLGISLDTSIPSATIPGSRLSSVTIRGRVTHEAFHALVPPTPVPNLRYMSLCQNNNPGNFPVSWQMANLRKLVLCGVELTPGSESVHHLTELHISNVDFNAFYRTISAIGAQALSHIELSNITGGSDRYAGLAQGLSVEQVQRLVIKDCDPRVIKLLFVHTQMPSLRHLSLSMGSLAKQEGMPIIRALAPLVRSGTTMLNGISPDYMIA